MSLMSFKAIISIISKLNAGSKFGHIRPNWISRVSLGQHEPVDSSETLEILPRLTVRPVYTLIYGPNRV